MPLGLTVRVGQLMELRALLPGERIVDEASVLGNAWVTIAGIRIVAGGDADEDHAEVHALRFPLDRVLNEAAPVGKALGEVADGHFCYRLE